MAVIASDSFNRSNSTTTLGSTDSAYGGTSYTWTTATTYGILSNQAQKQTGAATLNTTAWINPAVSDCAVSITFVTQGNQSRLIFRRSADSDLLQVNANGTTNYQIIRRQSSVNTVIGTIAVVPTNGDIVKASCNGSSITVTINGANNTTVTETFNQTATTHGFVTNDTVARLDDFKVEDIAIGTVTFTGSGTASGTSITSASNLTIRKQASGTTSGSSQSSVTPILRITASGVASGRANTTVSLGGVALHADGNSSGTSIATASPILRMQISGISNGKSTLAVIPIFRRTATGISNGVSWTSLNVISGNNSIYYYRKRKSMGLIY
ncbi:hypothetical protein [Paenibacillus anseongense]|uniref:hypothetical protein n=1 Tax=Paenibacillus anseongense TaxID=2682845 RepID=UPI002DB701A5|nr:hypothetical protein [Paenibacillus anseongense]MEC0265134.1 hypothetical protein [Paenibacillus anseongense]